ncbi:MAG: glycosyltransferase family 4 protein [Acetobacteraceae bacterium]
MGHRSTPADFAVLYAAEALLQPRTGVGRAALEVARAVAAREDAPELIPTAFGRALPQRLIEAPHDTAPTAATSGVRAALGRLGPARWGAGHLMRYRLRGLARQAGTPDRKVLLHEPNLIPRPFDDGPTVAVVNDMSWRHDPDSHPAERVRWLERTLPRALRQVTRFVAISRFTATEAVRELGIAPDRISVAPLAVSPAFRPLAASEVASVLSRHDLNDRGYVLAVGSLEPRKNLDRLAAAHAGLPQAVRRWFPLVLAGGSGWGAVDTAPHLAAALASGEARLLGHVPDADLPALYARAAAVAYVSLYEGFGLPVLEAMACGTPLLHAATTAVAETAGGAGFAVDPLDVTAMREALLQLLEDVGVQQRLRIAGMARASGFTWEATAQEILGVWREVLGVRGGLKIWPMTGCKIP